MFPLATALTAASRGMVGGSVGAGVCPGDCLICLEGSGLLAVPWPKTAVGPG